MRDEFIESRGSRRSSGTELKLDRPIRDADGEFAVCTIIVFPAVVFLFKEVVAESLNRGFKVPLRRHGYILAPMDLLDRDLCGRNVDRLVCRVGINRVAGSQIRTWSVSTGQLLRFVFSSSQGLVESIAWSPDGKTLASANGDPTIRLWDMENGKQIRALGHDRDANYVAWSRDGKALASASADRTVRVWQAANGQSLRVLRGHSDDVTGVAWSPDGKLLASSSLDESVRVWDVATGELLRILNNSDRVRSVAWSPDGKTIAAGGQDGATIRLWEAQTGRLLHTIKGHQWWVWGLAYSPDGNTLASASADKTIRLWDAATGEPLRTLEGHRDEVRQIAWNPDGQMLASTSEDDTVRFWPGTVTALLDQVRDRLRLFTPSSEECERYFGSPSCPAVR